MCALHAIIFLPYHSIFASYDTEGGITNLKIQNIKLSLDHIFCQKRYHATLHSRDLVEPLFLQICEVTFIVLP